MHITIVQVPAQYVQIALATIISCLIARWFSVLLPLAVLSQARVFNGNVLGLTNLLTWGGLRGGLALAMVLSLPDSQDKDSLLFMTFCVVAFSIICQGLSIGRLFDKAQLEKMLS